MAGPYNYSQNLLKWNNVAIGACDEFDLVPVVKTNRLQILGQVATWALKSDTRYNQIKIKKAFIDSTYYAFFKNAYNEQTEGTFILEIRGAGNVLDKTVTVNRAHIVDWHIASSKDSALREEFTIEGEAVETIA